MEDHLLGVEVVAGKISGEVALVIEVWIDFFRNLIVHQKKGGIHAIYRSIMETFG